MIDGLEERVEGSFGEAMVVWPDPEWRLVGPAYRADRCIHELIEDQVERRPLATAVVFGNQTLSYAELNHRANRLANYLQNSGVATETPVALFMERSPELAIAVLALLKSGAVNVPLDPDFPRDRLAFMLEDTQTRYILTLSCYAHALPPVDAVVICIDTAAPALALESRENPRSGVVADNLCTYYYTSGSTGTPKAVMMTHRVGCRLQWSHANAIKLDETDRALVATSVGYGFFLGEFASGLLRGATAVLARPGGYQDVDYLVEIVEREQITVISFVPSVLKHYLIRLKELGFERGRSLRHIISHGEALPAELDDEVRANLGVKLHKFFGLTEAPVAAYWTGTSRESGGRTMVGRPTDMECHLLDPDMKPVPVGEPGEFYISGPGVARGYLNRPGLTALRFLPNPFSHEPGGRFFRTGDFGRWLPEGAIELLGRGDDLIKLRGLRVELGEITTILGRHPAVRESVVVVREDRPGDKRIIAYAVFHDGQAPSSEELKTFLAHTLPEHMLPSSIVRLERMPLLVSGKVDRQALPAPGTTTEGRATSYVAPRNDLERRLVQVWTGLLELDAVGIHDDFFDLGGNSLLATRLFARIEKEFGRRLARSSLFPVATVEALAQALKATQVGSRPDLPILLKAGGPGPAFFLVHDGVGDTLPYLNLVRRLPAELTVYGIEPLGNDRCPILQTRITDMAAHYAAKIRQTQPDGPYIVGGLCGGGLIAFEVASQLEAQGDTVQFVVLLDSVGPQARLPHDTDNQRRWARFQGELRGSRGSPWRNLDEKVVRLTRKIVNYSRYTVMTQVADLVTRARFRLLRAAVDAGRPVPFYAASLPVISVFWRAYLEYAPTRALSSPILLFRATEGTGEDEPRRLRYNDPLLGWGPWVPDGLELYQVPGGHLSMLNEPHVAVLAAQLAARLQTALAPAEIKA